MTQRQRSVITFILGVVFCTQSVLGSYGVDTSLWSERRGVLKRVAVLPLAMPALPDPRFPSFLPTWAKAALSPFVSVQSAQRSTRANAPTVILVQDAHLHREAQSHIADALSALAHTPEGTSSLVVGLEGAPSGRVSIPVFSSSHRPALVRQLARGLMSSGVLNGAEAAVLSGTPFVLHGVEAPELYRAHVEVTRAAFAARPAAQHEVDSQVAALNLEKQVHYTPALVAFEAKNAAYENGQLPITDYAIYLDSQHAVSSPHLSTLVQAARLEQSLSFQQVERERTVFLRALLSRLHSGQIKELNSLSQALKMREVTPALYFSKLKTLAALCGVNLSRTPNFSAYLRYVEKTDSIDATKLFSELRAEREAVAAALIKTSSQRELVDRTRRWTLVSKLLGLSLTAEEWGEYRSTPVAPAFLKPFERFYELADERSHAMAKNLPLVPDRVSVLVAGGFHSAAVADALCVRGANVIAVSPRITNLDDNGASSLDVLASNRLPLDRLFAGERLFLPTPSELAARPETIARVVDAGAEAIEKLDARNTQSAGARSGNIEVAAKRATDEPPVTGFRVDRKDTGEDSVYVVASITGTPFDWLTPAIERARVSKDVFGFLFHGIKELGGILPTHVDMVALGILLLGDNGVQLKSDKRLAEMNVNPDSSVLGKWLDSNGLRTHVATIGNFEKKPQDEVLNALRKMLEVLLKTHGVNAENLLRTALRVDDGDMDLQMQLQFAVLDSLRDFGVKASRVQVKLLKGSDAFNTLSQVRLINPLQVVEEGIEEREVALMAHGTLRPFYIYEVGEEFIHSQVLTPEIIARVLSNRPDFDEAAAREWLLRELVGHELAEGVLRERSRYKDKDPDLVKATHALLVASGISGLAPVEASIYQQPLADRVKNVIISNPLLFNRAARVWAGVDTEGPVSFFGNQPTAQLIAAVIANNPSLYPGLRLAQESFSALVERVETMLSSLESLTPSIRRPLSQLLVSLEQGVGPFFDAALEAAGIQVLGEFASWGERSSHYSMSALNRFQLAPGVSVEIRVSHVLGLLVDENIAFVQRYQDDDKTRFVVHAPDSTLDRIKEESIPGILQRASVLGVAMSKEHAAEIATEQFLVHEIGEKILGISDADLLDLGIANEARLQLQEERDRDTLSPEQAKLNRFRRTFLSMDELIGALADKKASSGYASVLDDLAPVRRVLRDAFPSARPLNYSSREMQNLLAAGYTADSGGFAGTPWLEKKENDLTLVDASASVLHIQRLVKRLLRENAGNPIMLPLLMAPDRYQSALATALSNGTDEEKAAAQYLSSVGERVRLVGLLESEVEDLHRNHDENVLDGKIVQSLVARALGQNGRAVHRVSILAARPLTVEGADALTQLLIRVIVAVDVTVMGLDDKIRLEQVLFVQA